MRFKTTFILLFLNLIVGGVIFYLNYTQKVDQRFLDDSRIIFEESVLARAQQFIIESKDQEDPWIISFNDNQWIVESPFRWPANPYAINRLLNMLNTLKWETRFSVDSLESGGQNLANYGLIDPALTVSIISPDGSRQEIALGSPTEVGNRLYALSPDKTDVLVLDQSVKDAIGRDLQSFFNLNVFTLTPDETRALQIQDRSSGNVRVRLIRSSTGWRLSSPIDTAADSTAVLDTLLDISSQEILEFVDPGEVSQRFDDPAMRIVLEGFNSRETLLIANGDPESAQGFVLAKRELFPTIFKLPITFVQQLKSSQDSLREKRLLSEMSKEWTSLEIRMGNNSTVLQRLEGGDWQVVTSAPDGGLETIPADLQVVEQLRTQLESLEAVRFITDAPSESDLSRFGLLDPQRIISFRFEGRNNIELRIGNVTNEETLLYAKTNLGPSVSLIRPFILAEAPLNPLHYRKRNLLSLPDNINRISQRLIRLVDNQDMFNEAIENNPFTSESLTVLKNWLQSPNVSRFVSNRFSDPFVLDRERIIPWTYVFEIEYRLPGSDQNSSRTTRIYLSDPVGGTTQFIGSPDSQLVGTLPQPIISQISEAFKKQNEVKPQEDSEPDETSSNEPEPSSSSEVETL